MIFVDTNILIDLLEPGSAWHRWSRDTVSLASTEQPLVTNLVVFAELSTGFSTLDDQHTFLDGLGIGIAPLTDLAAFEAGRAFGVYRANGGTRTTILADLLIGGHALALGATLLTRDPKRFRTCLPELTLITPETDNG